MSYWKREPRLCPDCGCEMIFGDLDIDNDGPGLAWASRVKYALRERTIFGKQKIVYRRIRHWILNGWQDDLFEEYAWYCPKCGIIDVRFRAAPVEIVAAMADNDKTDAE